MSRSRRKAGKLIKLAQADIRTAFRDEVILQYHPDVTSTLVRSATR
jgi:hypothetical protein